MPTSRSQRFQQVGVVVAAVLPRSVKSSDNSGHVSRWDASSLGPSRRNLRDSGGLTFHSRPFARPAGPAGGGKCKEGVRRALQSPLGLEHLPPPPRPMVANAVPWPHWVVRHRPQDRPAPNGDAVATKPAREGAAYWFGTCKEFRHHGYRIIGSRVILRRQPRRLTIARSDPRRCGASGPRPPPAGSRGGQRIARCAAPSTTRRRRFAR